MTATGHALIGTIIAAKIGNPALAVPIAFTSHIIGDFVPHWDVATNRRKKKPNRFVFDIFLDISLGFILSFFLLSLIAPKTNFLYVAFIIIIAQSFDWFTAPYYLFHIKTVPFKWFYTLQKVFDKKLDKPYGIITQIATVCIFYLLFFKIF